MARIATIASISIDIERLKAISLNSFNDIGKTNVLTIEYNARTEYSRNPFTGEIDKTLVTDVISKEFPDYDTAQLYQKEIQECWEDYLNEKE